ncbi:class I SAM-dependent methyltransferase [Paraburkholderia solisilvae]|uniref:2-methoxy-6-polyprenyl-1,4-benzoquinol methylase, mitochondrial n=1 Tax=Paraburkholderia solisilvae TaxID=624376 RepID=A0A6J5DWF7_9BURK|nr:class I SAM-dependent methyltransferase [Paraburkholderia solisilvae]CAB3758293.1 2-methoxy-6-polyprenyl-1,4-benzoquinol methylase, mitochondrial [Paraburkholderia solisilvae]
MKILNTARVAFNTVRWNITNNFADVRADYDAASSTYDDYYGRYLGTVTDEFAAAIPLTGAERVLELAAGTGRLTGAICRRLGAGAHVTAVDLSERMLALNEMKHAVLREPRIDFRQGDALRVIAEQEDESIDAVLCAWGICYFNHDAFLSQVQRVLRPGGMLALIENRKCTLNEVSNLFERLVISRPAYLRKAIRLNLPEDAASLARKFCSDALHAISQWDGGLDIPYTAASEVREYMLKSGASAGFLDAIEPAYRDEFLDAFERLVAEQPRRVPLLHQYSALIARKR